MGIKADLRKRFGVTNSERRDSYSTNKTFVQRPAPTSTIGAGHGHRQSGTVYTGPSDKHKIHNNGE